MRGILNATPNVRAAWFQNGLFSLASSVSRPFSPGVPRFWIYLALLLVTASWGAVLPVLRFVNAVREQHGLSSLDIVWLRIVPGAICFAPILFAQRTTSLHLIRRHWLAILVAGLLTTSLYNLFLVLGEERVPAAIASLMIGLNPSTAFIMSVLFLGERATLRKVAGLAVSLFGLAWVALPHPHAISAGAKSPTAATPAYGWYHLLLTAGAPVAFSAGTIIVKKFLRHVRPLNMTAATVVAGALPLLPLPFLQGRLISAAPALPASFWAAIAFLVIVPLVLGYMIWYMALDILDATRVSSFIFLVPVFGVALSAFTNEPPSAGVLVGGAVVLAGVLLTNWHTPAPVPESV